MLERDRIQGNVIPGLNKEYEAFVLVHMPNGAAGRNWLSQFCHEDVWEITTADEVEQFKRLRRLAEKRRPHEESILISSTHLNLAFSRGGMLKLCDGDDPGLFGEQCGERAFLDNRYTRSQVGEEQQSVDALLIVAADKAGDLDSELTRQRDRIQHASLVVIETLRGNQLAGAREHFGFKDGIAQPNVEGDTTSNPAGPALKAGEFILGYEDEAGYTGFAHDGLARNGSYLTLLKFKQDVAAFRTSVDSGPRAAGLTRAELGAALVGRDQDGVEVGEPLEHLSHIRRAHPARMTVQDDEPDRHRLLRRGIPYGQPLPENTAIDDGADRGLLFLAYQADIRRQFEHVWVNWLNNPDFPIRGAGNDPLLGSASNPGEPRDVVVSRADAKGGNARLRLPQFVWLDYGGYFFAPSIPALVRLANGKTRGAEREEKGPMPYTPNYAAGAPKAIWIPEAKGVPDYITFLFEQNPYNIDPAGFTADLQKVERDGPAWANGKGSAYTRKLNDYLALPENKNSATDPLAGFLHWKFQGDDIRISKALRIDYDYTPPASGSPADQPPFKGYILIGFAGPVWG